MSIQRQEVGVLSNDLPAFWIDNGHRYASIRIRMGFIPMACICFILLFHLGGTRPLQALSLLGRTGTDFTMPSQLRGHKTLAISAQAHAPGRESPIHHRGIDLDGLSVPIPGNRERLLLHYIRYHKLDQLHRLAEKVFLQPMY